MVQFVLRSSFGIYPLSHSAELTLSKPGNPQTTSEFQRPS